MGFELAICKQNKDQIIMSGTCIHYASTMHHTCTIIKLFLTLKICEECLELKGFYSKLIQDFINY